MDSKIIIQNGRQEHAIENLVQLLEDRGIKVGIISGFEHFNACTFKADGDPVIVTKGELSGDRQRFNLGHELGHLILDVQGDLKPEQAANRFVGAFLVPAATARFELGANRTDLNINELHMLKHKYGLVCKLGFTAPRIFPLLLKTPLRTYSSNFMSMIGIARNQVTLIHLKRPCGWNG